jgi:hypothetical protein
MSNLVKDENGDLVVGSHNILNRLKNYFSHLLNVHKTSYIRQIEIHTTEPLTELNIRDLPGGKGRPALKADNLTAICEPTV